ncbi:MAG: nucleotide sugar dehydrogenase [candidate division KSB1 bacterium]|nr:nucleotide sugar dehydrogenase [candidate division KSB1 bacterium]
MNLSIFGLGYVGCVGMGCFSQLGNTVIGVDRQKDKVRMINQGIATIEEKGIDELVKTGRQENRIKATVDAEYAVLHSEISLICVGTLNSPDGHLDLNAVYSVADSIGDTLKKKKEHHITVIRSTVLPGTHKEIISILESRSGKSCNKDFSVVSNPEFLREGTAVQDFLSPPFTILASENNSAIDKLKSLYQEIQGEIIVTDIEIAELIKLVNNSFHALKVSFANEIGRICNRLGVNSQDLMQLFCKDQVLNISPQYLKPGFAYGGSCLPKDLKALNIISHDHYLHTPLLKAISESNDAHIQFAKELILEINKSKITFLSITFKPGTDDLRWSPALELVEYFLGKGFDVKIYDKNLNLSKLIGRNKSYLLERLPHIEGVLVDSIEEAVKFGDIIVIANKEPYIYNFLIPNNLIQGKLYIDLVGMLKGDTRENVYRIY